MGNSSGQKDESHSKSQRNTGPESAPFSWKLWLYTNFDCNLSCTYCVAESSPVAPRRPLGLQNVERLVDEAVSLGFKEVFFTGGEPFILDDIYEMLAYATTRMPTTVLTNAMLLRGSRLTRLRAIAHDNLVVQVSLDGGRAEEHDAYRGHGTWARTVAGIKALQAAGFRVKLSTTETPANTQHLDNLDLLRRSLGIAEDDHFIRPLARRGFSQEGVIVKKETLLPEVTVTSDGIFWHPLASPSSKDMLISRDIFPLAAAANAIQDWLDTMDDTNGAQLECFT
jgi:MoaA/NifB/PqqE/SkfB family radical SAM enzyme